MEFILLYCLPMLVSFFLMSACHNRGLSDSPFAGLPCIIPIINIIMIFIYIKKLTEV